MSARDLRKKYGFAELTEEQKARNLEHNTGIEPRPAPELPEGYREGERGQLVRDFIGGPLRMADIDSGGRLWVRMPLEPEEIPALTIWLQRRAK